MYCENCGHKITEDDVNFCPNCGHSIKHYNYSKFTLFFYSIENFFINIKNKYVQLSGGKKVLLFLSIFLIIQVLVSGSMLATIMQYNDNQVDSNTYSSYSAIEDSNDENYSTTLISQDSSSSHENSYSGDSSDSSESSQSGSNSKNYESSGSGGSYVGSANSNKFHYPSCRYVNNIKSGNLITFSSRDDAISSGYSPCKVCCP